MAQRFRWSYDSASGRLQDRSRLAAGDLKVLAHPSPEDRMIQAEEAQAAAVLLRAHLEQLRLKFEPKLTPQRRHVFRLLLKEETPRSIAKMLRIALKTVMNYRSELIRDGHVWYASGADGLRADGGSHPAIEARARLRAPQTARRRPLQPASSRSRRQARGTQPTARGGLRSSPVTSPHRRFPRWQTPASTALPQVPAAAEGPRSVEECSGPAPAARRGQRQAPAQGLQAARPEASIAKADHQSWPQERAAPGKRLSGVERQWRAESRRRQGAEAEMTRRDRVGARLSLAEQERPQLAATAARPQALTVMFVDLVGCATMQAHICKARIAMLWALAAAVVPRGGGRYINTWGDAIVAGFEQPTEGLVLACRLLQHLRVEEIEARIGLSHGLVELHYNPLTHRMDMMGDSLHEGARLEPLAHTGEVLIAEALRSHPAVEATRFLFTPVQRVLSKAVGQQSPGVPIPCYSVRLAKDTP